MYSVACLTVCEAGWEISCEVMWRAASLWFIVLVLVLSFLLMTHMRAFYEATKRCTCLSPVLFLLCMQEQESKIQAVGFRAAEGNQEVSNESDTFLIFRRKRKGTENHGKVVSFRGEERMWRRPYGCEFTFRGKIANEENATPLSQFLP